MIERFGIESGLGSVYIGLTTPIIVAGSACLLLVTNAPLPLTRVSWIFKPFQYFRRIGGMKMNQFGMGELNFTSLFVFLIALPVVVYFTKFGRIIGHAGASKALKLKAFANYFGMAGVMALSFF